MKRFQFCWYGWHGDTWRRFFFERFEGGLRFIYRWRIAVGPLDVRRWRPRAETLDLIAKAER